MSVIGTHDKKAPRAVCIYNVNDNIALAVKVDALMKIVMDKNALAAKLKALT